MTYLNAHEALPPELVEAIQEYVQGAALYIPKSANARAGWGLANGSRAALDARNESIRELKRLGASLDELAERYALSVDAVRKVLYGPNRGPRGKEGP
jgi:Mor family transcriptional regulator